MRERGSRSTADVAATAVVDLYDGQMSTRAQTAATDAVLAAAAGCAV